MNPDVSHDMSHDVSRDAPRRPDRHRPPATHRARANRRGASLPSPAGTRRENISAILRRAARGHCTFDDAVRLLSLPPDSPDALRLRRAAHRAGLRWTGGRGHIWFAIGMDGAPCPRSCAFCSFGERWGLAGTPWRLAGDEAVAAIRAHDVPGVGYIVLRTTDLFPLDDLAEIARRVMPLRHARLVANVGDFREDTARRLHGAGFRMIYHALRLREGTDTGIAPAVRLRTMHAAMAGGLALAALADPAGPEHEAREIARVLFLHKCAGADVLGAMARVPVPGTPKHGLGAVTPERHAQLTAVARLVAEPRVPAICAHPPHALLAESGANVLVVEHGAIPRDTQRAHAAWRSFSLDDAAAMLRAAGYRVG